jgi:uncharacterized protein involved in exopolysaccharide biosynthesis
LNTDVPALPEIPEGESGLWNAALRSVGSLFKVAFLISLLVTLGSFLVSNKYRSTATLLPEDLQSASSALAALSNVASLIGVPSTGFEKLYPTIVSSEAVLRRVIYRPRQIEGFPGTVDLVEFWGIEEDTPLEEYERALKRLRRDLDVSVDSKTDVVTVSLATSDSTLSAQIVQEIILGTDAFLRHQHRTYATEQGRWIDSRLSQVQADLRHAEDSLRTFRQVNRVIASPPLVLAESRLVRQVDLNSALFLDLSRQREATKIDEIKNVPVLNVLDYARISAIPDSPDRVLIAIVSFILSFLGGLAFIAVRGSYPREVSAAADWLRHLSGRLVAFMKFSR